jgi:hypothetical protein
MASPVDIILKKYKQGKREDLIPLLQDLHDELGYLSEEAIVKVGGFLGMSTTKIFGLATFYDRFRFFPAGKIQIRRRPEYWPDRPRETGISVMILSHVWEDATTVRFSM